MSAARRQRQGQPDSYASAATRIVRGGNQGRKKKDGDQNDTKFDAEQDAETQLVSFVGKNDVCTEENAEDETKVHRENIGVPGQC